MNVNFIELFSNPCLWAAFWSWTVAQCAKMLCGFLSTRRVNFSYLLSTGGMPSAHSSLVTGLATSVGLFAGFDTPVFMVALAFAAITMFDAATVRRAAGIQARLLNEMLDELFREHHLSERKLKELLGHTRLEVLMGAIVGILTAMLVASYTVLST